MDMTNKSIIDREDQQLQVPILFPQIPKTSQQQLISSSSIPISDFLQHNMDVHLSNLLQLQKIFILPKSIPPKKRGRKPLRPNDPIKKKTEQKDKFWLRAFRAYIKANYKLIKDDFSVEQTQFWINHIGANGKPEKGKQFLSYGKQYKNFLFSNQYFVRRFRNWFQNFGFQSLLKKCNPQNQLWSVFYNYACQQLINYIPPPKKILPKSPLSTKTQTFTLDQTLTCVDSDFSIDHFFDSK